MGSAEQKEIDDLAVAFCGAGDGPFIDKLSSNAWNDACTATSLDEACEAIEASVKNTYKEFGRIYQAGACPEVQLIYGAKMNHGSRMFSAMGPIVNEKDGFDCGGVGHYMASFLASRMYKNYLPIQQCVILAAYILFQAKEHVDGCGGDSQIVVLREDASSGAVDWKRVEVMTELLSLCDREISELILKAADLNASDKELKEAVDLTASLMDTFRLNQRTELESHADMARAMLGPEMKPEDYLGLPMTSDDQTSEPEQ
jgi:hypothetical protein